jgi:hypothetical protein
VTINIDFALLKTAWLQWQADHPTLAHLFVIVESAAIGALVDIVTNGVDFSGQGLKHAGTIIVTAVAMSLRNYLKDNAKTLKLQLDAKKGDPT